MATPACPLRIAVFEAAVSDKWKGLTEQYMRESFGRPSDTFTMFNTVLDEFPSLEDVAQGKYDVICISGSPHSVYEDFPWIKKLTQLLPKYMATGKVRIVGCCFGHQILAKALGGVVDKNPSGRFVLKVEDVAFDAAALQQCGLYKYLEEPNANQAPVWSSRKAGEATAAAASQGTENSLSAAASDATSEAEGRLQPRSPVLKLIESHGDQVLQLPPGAVLLASSATASCEMWTLPGRCLAAQFHAEFPGTAVVLEKIHSTLSGNGRLDPEEAAHSETSLRTDNPNPAPVRAMIRAFMEGAAPDSLPGSSSDTAAAAATSDAPAVSSSGAAAASSSGAPAGEKQSEGASRRDSEMADELAQMVQHLRAGFTAGLKPGGLAWAHQSHLNAVVAGQCGNMADVAGALAEFSQRLSEKQQGSQAELANVQRLESQLEELLLAADALEAQSKQLAADVGLPDTAGAASLFGWR